MPYPSYPAVTTAVTLSAIEAFADAVGAEPDHGVPPTFAAVYALGANLPQMLADPTIGIDVRRMLHGEQEFIWDNHPTVGEELTARGQVVHDERKGSLRRVTLETKVTGTDGRKICTARSMMVIR